MEVREQSKGVVNVEENIQDIKRNLDEIKKDLQKMSVKNRNQENIGSELFLVNERIWNIEQYVLDLETFI